jgi:site-specific DNA recombinase
MKTAIYLRVSTNRQTQAQTIEQQLERLRKHLDLQGEALSADNIFPDDGYSSANLNRPSLDRLRDRVKGGILDRVLLTSPDRLARNYVHQMVLVEEWERCGCKVEFLDRPMSQDPHDQLLLQIRRAVAEYERVLIAERMPRGRQMKLKAGALLPWTVPPYGYRLAPDRPRDPTGVQIEPAEGAIVRELFARYLEDKGTLLSLTKHLLQLRLPSPRGNQRWSAASIRGLLINPVYTGKLYIGRSRSRPARIRRSATHPLGNPAHGQDPTPVEVWILIGTCVNPSAFARTTNGGLRYYICRCQAQPIYSQHDQRYRSRCIPAQQLDVLVWEDLCQLISQPDYIIDALQRARGGQWLPQELQSRKQTLRKAQVGINQQLERLTEAYLMAIIPLAEYQRRRSELEQKSQALRPKRRNWMPKSIGKRSWFSWVHRSRISAAGSTPVWSMPRLIRNARWWNC